MVESDFEISDSALNAWHDFVGNPNNKGHANRDSFYDDLNEQFSLSLMGARKTIERVCRQSGIENPPVILEIGSSVGFNVLALRERFPGSIIFGVEPEVEAVEVARKIVFKAVDGATVPNYIVGRGESIDLPDSSVDFILCNTVIEHVDCVADVMSEVSRVLKPGGKAWFEAPNYMWPKEPHLGIWCIPMLGKKIMALFAIFQGKKRQLGFLEHLKLVTPFCLEREFKRNALSFENRAIRKLESVLKGGDANIEVYKLTAKTLRLLNKIGFGKLIVLIAEKTGFYPSVIYLVKK